MTKMDQRSSRKVKKGVVVSNKMQKTVVVRVNRFVPDKRYGKPSTVSKKYYAHTEAEHQVGDEVKIIESRPMSKLKRWAVLPQ